MSDLSDELLQQAANLAWVREQDLSYEAMRPFRLMQTQISWDGNKWCVLYGANLQNGVAGFGDSPDEASRAFDAAWYAKIERVG
jgi:hypothetical protein